MRQGTVILIGSLETGGAQRVAIWLLEEHLRAGLDCRLIAVDCTMDMVSAGSPEAVGRHIHCLGGLQVTAPTLAKWLSAPLAWLRLQILLLRLRPVRLISFMERANILSLLTVVPVRRVLSVRSHPDLIAGKAAGKRIGIALAYRFLLRRAHRLVFNSAEAAQAFRRRYPVGEGITRIIANPLNDAALFGGGASPPARQEDGAATIVAVGRLKPEKGHWQLLRAFADVRRRLPDLNPTLVILGDGPLRRPLQELAEALGIGPSLRLPGFTPTPAQWLQQADIFVLPSIWEGFPNALLEAMAMGCAVVAADCRSGPREILAPDTDPEVKTATVETTRFGMLTPPLTLEALPAAAPLTAGERGLAEAMARLLRDDDLRRRLRNGAAERATRYDRAAIFAAWQELDGGPTASLPDGPRSLRSQPGR
ncbi:MAG: glycosyltransferase [Thermodesulfobacteriota bacterium]